MRTLCHREKERVSEREREREREKREKERGRDNKYPGKSLPIHIKILCRPHLNPNRTFSAV